MKTINQPAITAHHVTLGFKEKLIVSDLSLTIQSGEFIGILGPNGSGKSTFLKAILGLIQPLQGHLFVWGKAPLAGRAQMGYMPQTHQQAIPTHFTGRAILEITIHGMQYGLPLSTRKANAIINHALEKVQATHYADRPFYQLSGGEKQRIYFAQALLNTPALLLLDEPLANLDPSMQEMFIHLLKTIQQTSGATILLTAHDPNPLLPIMCS